MCVGSLTICCNPNWEVTPSILKSLHAVMSLLYQRLDFTLKSPRTTVRKGLFTIVELNESKSSRDWLGERCNEIKVRSLPLILASEFKMDEPR